MQRLTTGRTPLIVLGLVAMLALGLAVPALAQSDDASTESEATDEVDVHGARVEEFAAALADELGDDVTTEEVADALDAVRERVVEQRAERMRDALTERLDDAVAQGALTQEQADAIAEAAEEGVLSPRALRGELRGPWHDDGDGPRGLRGGFGAWGGVPLDAPAGDVWGA